MNPLVVLFAMACAALLTPAVVGQLREWRRRTCHACWIEQEGALGRFLGNGPSGHSRPAPFIRHTCSKRRLTYRKEKRG